MLVQKTTKQSKKFWVEKAMVKDSQYLSNRNTMVLAQKPANKPIDYKRPSSKPSELLPPHFWQGFQNHPLATNGAGKTGYSPVKEQN